MEKFNNTSLFTGYLKQFLHNFNLPKLKVYTEEQAKYFEENGTERFDVLETVTVNPNETFPEHLRYIPYLKDGWLQEYVNGEWKIVGTRSSIQYKAAKPYNYGEKILNYTKNLIIKNNVYDTYTHEYLGDYLRFQRDYFDIDLMPLYNCFNNTTTKNLYINNKFLIQTEHYEEILPANLPTEADYIGKYYKTSDDQYLIITDENISTFLIRLGETKAYKFVPTRTGEFIFDSADANYKIYAIPVKLFKTYTIALDSELPIELCCGIYGKYQDTREKFAEISGLTYKKLSHCQFTKPFLYTEILNLNQLTLSNSIVELAQNEADLKLFLKIPVANNSTIVILEGDYLNWNDFIYRPAKQQIINIEAYGSGAPTESLSVAEKEYYLDTKNKVLYQYLNSTWQPTGPIWDAAAIQLLKVPLNGSNKLNQLTLIIDENYYAWQGINGEMRELPANDYFNYYLQNHPTKYSKNLAYFNTAIKKLFINDANTWLKKTNHSVIDMDNITEEKDIPLRTPLQLLRSNTSMQYPFADRLVEYLLENCITNRVDEIDDNIKRVQKALHLNYNSNNYNAVFPGMWDRKINKIIYQYMSTNHDTFETNHDILGYIDKDAEKYYSHTDVFEEINPETQKTSKKYKSTSISTIELTEEEK